MQPLQLRACQLSMTTFIAAIALAGCSGVRPDVKAFEPATRPTSFPGGGPESECIAKSVSASNSAVTIYPDGILDETTSSGTYKSSGLSLGGRSRIASVLDEFAATRKILIPNPADSNDIVGYRRNEAIHVISGSWTIHDRRGNSIGGGLKIQFGGAEFKLGGDDGYDLIGGDFRYSRGPYILRSFSLGIVVRTNSGSADILFAEEGKGAAVSVKDQTVEGRHSAQMIMVRLATILIISDIFGVNASPCFKETAPQISDILHRLGKRAVSVFNPAKISPNVSRVRANSKDKISKKSKLSKVVSKK